MINKSIFMNEYQVRGEEKYSYLDSDLDKSGVYQIIINHNERYIYFGETRSFIDRWLWHLKDLDNKNHHNYRLQEYYDNGAKLFFVSLDFLNKKNRKIKELEYINKYPECINLKRSENG